MHLKVNSPEKVIFDWKVEKVKVPTLDGEIWILPWHHPLSTIVKPGILEILSVDKLENTDFLLDDWKINISISKWILFVSEENILLLVSSVTVNPKNTEKELIDMKESLSKEIELAKSRWSIEEIEKKMINLQKILADLKLSKLKTKN
jgi:F0F1-type ATP synthase epsilon subunit